MIEQHVIDGIKTSVDLVLRQRSFAGQENTPNPSRAGNQRECTLRNKADGALESSGIARAGML